MPGWKSLIVCEGIPGQTAADGTPLPECSYESLVLLVQALISDMVIIATFIAVALFAYAGFKMLLSQGSETEYKKAVEMFKKLAWGYVWILIAWLVVYTISKALLKPEFSIF